MASVWPCSMMRNSWPSRVKTSLSLEGSGNTILVGSCPGHFAKNGISSDCLRISCTDFGVAIARASGNRCSSAPTPTK